MWAFIIRCFFYGKRKKDAPEKNECLGKKSRNSRSHFLHSQRPALAGIRRSLTRKMPPKLNAMRYFLATILTLLFSTATSAQGLRKYFPANSATSCVNLQIKACYLPKLHALPFSPQGFGDYALPDPSTFKMQAMPVVYAVSELPMFCKWEVKLEKAATFPVKFRLGEVQYVEHLEGKY